MVNNVWKGNKQKIVTIVVVVTLFLFTFAFLANTGFKLYDTKFANEFFEGQKENINHK